MRLLLLIPGLMLLSHCGPAPVNTSRTYEAYSQPVYMAVGKKTDSKFELFFSPSYAATELSVCVKTPGQSDDEGICIPADKDGKYYKIQNVELKHQLHLKITGKDSSGNQQVHVLEVREAGQQVVQPQPTVSPIPESMNFGLTSAEGAKLKVNDVFKKKYLLVEFSAYDCGPCRSFAQSFNRNAAQYESWFEKGQCSKMVLVDDYGGLRGRFENWVSMLGGSSSYLGKASYTSGLGIREAANKLGFTRQFGIPTLIMLDRSGKVVDSATGDMPAKMKELCVQ
jgi:thiol-disulfide isomerase/thioredoxin